MGLLAAAILSTILLSDSVDPDATSRQSTTSSDSGGAWRTSAYTLSTTCEGPDPLRWNIEVCYDQAVERARLADCRPIDPVTYEVLSETCGR